MTSQFTHTDPLQCKPRSSALSAEGTLPITEDELRSFASAASDMERGLLETLMGAPDENSTLKRNKGSIF